MTNTSGYLNSIGSVLYVLVVVASILEVGLISVFFSHESTFNIELFLILGKKRTFGQKSSKQTRKF